MRYGSLCSALLHGSVVALLLAGLDDAGGAPSLGTGGTVHYEVVLSLPGAVPTRDATAASAIETRTPPHTPAETTAVASSAPPPNAAAVAATFDLPPVPVGPSPNTPAAAALGEPMADVVPLPPTRSAEREPAEVIATEPTEHAAAAPPEKPTRKVAVPAPQLAQQTPPEPPLEPAADVPAAGTAKADAEAAPVGAQQAALPGDNNSQDLGSPGLAGPAGGATRGMNPGELQDYADLLVAWLDQHKRYPDPARRRKQEGIVVVEFAIDGQGRVLSHRLLETSGHQLLDAEAEALLERASPVPALPDGTGRSFQLPIVFALR